MGYGCPNQPLPNLQRCASMRAQSKKLLYTYLNGTRHHPLGRTGLCTEALHSHVSGGCFLIYSLGNNSLSPEELPRASGFRESSWRLCVRVTSGQLLRTLPRKILAWRLPFCFSTQHAHPAHFATLATLRLLGLAGALTLTRRNTPPSTFKSPAPTRAAAAALASCKLVKRKLLASLSSQSKQAIQSYWAGQPSTCLLKLDPIALP